MEKESEGKRLKDKSNKVKIHNRLFFQVYLCFGVIISVFMLLVGSIFISLYKNSTMDVYITNLKARGKSIAGQVSEYAINKKYSQYVNYMEAVESIEENEGTDVWILSYLKSDNHMAKKFQNVSIKRSTMSKDMRTVLFAAYQNKVTYKNSYDKIYDEITLRVGIPIYDAGGNVMGAVLMNSIVETQNERINQGVYLVIISILVSWIVSAILAGLFAGQLSRPITKLRLVAKKLTNGEYTQKTGIRRKDEIGQLAQSIDILSGRLDEIAQERGHLDQMRHDFFANVSHELRTPITVIRGYAESLKDGMVSEEEDKQRYYTRMLSECQGMQRLVADLLILSKMQNPEFVIEKEPLHLGQIFEDVIRSAKVLSEEKNLEINYVCDEESCFILGDYHRIRQMFMIIFDNAIKFSPENESVEIDVRGVEHTWQVTITDHGIGIPAKELSSVFEKFYRSKLEMNSKGSGLGLMIAKEIAVRHDVSIEVKSEEGVGTAFRFTFEKLDFDENGD